VLGCIGLVRVGSGTTTLCVVSLESPHKPKNHHAERGGTQDNYHAERGGTQDNHHAERGGTRRGTR